MLGTSLERKTHRRKTRPRMEETPAEYRGGDSNGDNTDDVLRARRRTLRTIPAIH